jgi:hypothetical protein
MEAGHDIINNVVPFILEAGKWYVVGLMGKCKPTESKERVTSISQGK